MDPINYQPSLVFFLSSPQFATKSLALCLISESILVFFCLVLIFVLLSRLRPPQLAILRPSAQRTPASRDLITNTAKVSADVAVCFDFGAQPGDRRSLIMASAPVHDGAVNTHDSISTPAPAHPLPVQSQNEKTVQQPYAMYAMPHGQQYQVYPGQQYLEPPGPVINKGWEMTKYVLHGLSIVCCICGIALVLSVRGINFPLPVVLCPIVSPIL